MQPTSTKGLLVSEVYGPVWQGEGRQRGQLAAFVRLGGCNLHCHWCDTPFTWAFDARHAMVHDDKKQYDPRVELTRMTPEDILTAVEGLQAARMPLIIFSGGEPMLQQRGIELTLNELSLAGYEDFAIETAGTRDPLGWELAVHYTVSPKLSNSGNDLNERYKPEILREYSRLWSDFKFVVTNESDLREVDFIVQDVGIPRELVWIMPEGRKAQEIITKAQVLAPEVLKRGYNFTLRDHVLMYGDERQR